MGLKEKFVWHKTALQKKPALNAKAQTMVELLVATGVFLIAVVAIIYSYITCLALQDLGRNISLTTAAVKNEMETIKNTTFSTIFATYNNQTFTTPGVNGTGTIYVNNSNANLLVVTIEFSWTQPNGRTIGGTTDGNGHTTSYVQIATQICGGY